jgi:two-component system, OmpR family, response regulator
MRLLIVEDEPTLCQQIRDALSEADYAVDTANSGLDAEYLGETEPYDLAILDLGLPQKDGLSILEGWRSKGFDFPVLVLTARDRWTQKVDAFDAGADDYVVKPFHMEELMARVRALLRRRNGHAQSIIEINGLTVDTRGSRALIDGMPLKLTSHEFRVLHYLAQHVGKVVSRTELTEHIYDQDFDRDSNTIEVFVGRLRRKIGSERIETVRGLGYRLIEAESDRADAP